MGVTKIEIMAGGRYQRKPDAPREVVLDMPERKPELRQFNLRRKRMWRDHIEVTCVVIILYGLMFWIKQ